MYGREPDTAAPPSDHYCEDSAKSTSPVEDDESRLTTAIKHSQLMLDLQYGRQRVRYLQAL